MRKEQAPHFQTLLGCGSQRPAALSLFTSLFSTGVRKMNESYPELGGLTVRQLREFCKERKITGYSKYPRKADLLAFIQERIAENKSDRPSEAGGEAPQITEGQCPDVMAGASAAGQTETPDVAIDELAASTTSGVSELLLTAYPGEVAVRGRERLSHQSLYSTDTSGQLFEISSTLDRSTLCQQKSPQVGSAIANKGKSAISWGDCAYQGANSINNLAEMVVDISRIAALPLPTAANRYRALGNSGQHWEDLAPTGTDLRGITLARQCITITAFYFRASRCLGPHPLEVAAKPTPHLLLTQPSYMGRARPTGSLQVRTNPARAP